MNKLVPAQHVEHCIYRIRDHQVMLDSDLADLYGVPTFRLNEQVRRNLRRFPDDFMFRLTSEEAKSLRSQNAILKSGGRGQHKKYTPYAFTEQGVPMLSGVLRSQRAIDVNIAIMRAFVRVRKFLTGHQDLAHKLQTLEYRMTRQDVRSRRHSRQIRAVFDAIQALIQGRDAGEDKPINPVGFLK